MELVFMIPLAGLAAVFYAAYLAWDVLRRDPGTPEMQDVSSMIFEGAMAFLKRQYSTIAVLAIVTAVAIAVIVGAVSEGVKDIIAEGSGGNITIGYSANAVVDNWEEGLLTGIAFLVGAAASALAGYIGMYISVRSNARTASAATRSLKEAITVSLRGGAVSGFLVVALSLLGVSSIFFIYSQVLGNPDAIAPFLIVGFGFGASFVALFAQLGGGIYTKAADVGADLVGKVEAGIPEDDPRNAAVIADLVGDNVEWIIFPLVLRSFGILATIAGLTSVPFFASDDQKNPMTPLNYGYYIVSILSVVGLLITTTVMLGDEWYWFFFCGLIGIGTGIAFVYITQYYTSGAWRPVRDIANASRTGPATNIIIGTSVGMETTAATAITIAFALVASFFLGSEADIPGVGGFTTGVFGTAVATMGMLMSAAYILAMDTFGPITDNAGGITEFSGAPESARHITDALDSVGNTTKALTKGFAVASAGLAAFLLFSAYLDKVKERVNVPLNEQLPIDLSSVDVFAGGLIGVMLVFLFSSLAIRAVGNAAGAIIEEVRRQFREDPGILAGTSRPDYGRAVDITARAALREMIAPGLLAVGMPIAVGLLFRFTRSEELILGDRTIDDPSGWLAVAGLLMVGTIGGIILATFFNNVGGAWDNAKKYIEAGHLQVESANPGAVETLGKGTDAHKAAVVGDTVGDPFKDTAGPSLHVLIKLLSTITLVLAPLFIP